MKTYFVSNTGYVIEYDAVKLTEKSVFIADGTPNGRREARWKSGIGWYCDNKRDAAMAGVAAAELRIKAYERQIAQCKKYIAENKAELGLLD